MASDIAMDVRTNDLIIKDGDLMLIDYAERTAQQILITLRFWLGEWFLNISEGVPYLEYVLVKKPNLNHIRQIFTDAIKSVEGVTTLVDMQLDFDRQARKLTVEYEVDTNYGLITRKEVLGYGRGTG